MGDFLYNLTEWIRSTQMTELALSISETSLSQMMAINFWAIPIVQVIHILAISASFASVLMINARIFGIAGHATVAETSRRYTKVLWWSLLVLLLSGFLMIVGEPVRELINSIFWIKMVLIVTAILVVIAFQSGVGRRIAAGYEVGGATKATAVVLVVLWCAIMFAGRWIAYAPV